MERRGELVLDAPLAEIFRRHSGLAVVSGAGLLAVAGADARLDRRWWLGTGRHVSGRCVGDCVDHCEVLLLLFRSCWRWSS